MSPRATSARKQSSPRCWNSAAIIPAAAHYADRAAAQIDRLSETVRSRQFGEMVTDAEDFARRQPALFIAVAVAAGFVIGRLLARPSRRDHRTAAGESYRPGYRPGGEAMAGYGAGSGIGGERL